MRVENNNLIKASLRDSESPPPGSIPRDEQRHLQRTPSHTSHEGEGHFIPEDDGVRVQSSNFKKKSKKSVSYQEKDGPILLLV